MTSQIINDCYINHYGIDLRKYHKEICTLQENEQALIENINKNHRITFSDGISSSFRLVIYNNLIYLLGDKSCYPCSHVINSAYGENLNWVQCIVTPSDTRITGETDIRKSAIIIAFITNLVAQIPDANVFDNFIKNLELAFINNEWFKRINSLTSYIYAARFWDFHQKISQLFLRGLFYPLEYVIYIIYNDAAIKDDQIEKYFIASLAESTNKIFPSEEILGFLKTLSTSDLEEIFLIDYVRDNINTNLIDDNYFADIIELDGVERYGMFINEVYYLDYMRENTSKIFTTPNFKKNYLKLLSSNFRKLENRMRKEKGFDNVGTLFMEKLLLHKLKQEFPHLTFLTQYSPTWLRPLRLDIYIKELTIAIEYQGAQHFLPIDFFGGKEGLLLRQKLDRIKKLKCKSQGIPLIEIRYDEDIEDVLEFLKKNILESKNFHN